MTPDKELKPCDKCGGSGWVCEKHPNKPHEHKVFFTSWECSGAGMPCECNKANPPWKFHRP